MDDPSSESRHSTILESPAEAGSGLQTFHAMSPQVEESTSVIKKPAVENKAASKILFLDGLRGLAVILVICEHVSYIPSLYIGAFGVHTFFVLSAFLLTMILDKKFRALHADGGNLRRWGYALLDYAARRLLRVYPLFAMVVIYIAFLSDANQWQWYRVDESLRGDNWNLFKMLTFQWDAPVYVLWTIPMELLYYLIIPVFVLVMMVLKRWWWLTVAPLVFYFVYAALYHTRNSFSPFSAHLPTFLCGSLAAIVYCRAADHIQKTGFEFQRWHRILLLLLEAGVLFVLVSECFEALLFDWAGPSPFKHPKCDHFVSLHVSIIIVCEMLQPTPISRALEWNVLRFIGKISFSVYILHPRVIFSAFIESQKNFYTRFFSMWALVFFWGTVSHYVVERPCQHSANWVGKKIKALDVKAKAKQPLPLGM